MWRPRPFAAVSRLLKRDSTAPLSKLDLEAGIDLADRAPLLQRPPLPATPTLISRRFSSSSGAILNQSETEVEFGDLETSAAKKAEVALAAPTPPADHYSPAAAYQWLARGLRHDKSVTSMTLATALILGEGFLASQPPVLLGRIVDAVTAASASPAAAAASVTAASGSTAALATAAAHNAVWPLFTLIGASIVGKEVCTVGRKFLVERAATSLQKAAFLEQVCVCARACVHAYVCVSE